VGGCQRSDVHCCWQTLLCLACLSQSSTYAQKLEQLARDCNRALYQQLCPMFRSPGGSTTVGSGGASIKRCRVLRTQCAARGTVLGRKMSLLFGCTACDLIKKSCQLGLHPDSPMVVKALPTAVYLLSALSLAVQAASREDWVALRCRGTTGGWCGLYDRQAWLQRLPAPRGQKTCPTTKHGVRVLQVWK
jgi:hypothetical protein